MSPSAPPLSQASVRAPRILLVDDDPVVLRAVRRLLLSTRPEWGVDLADSVENAFRRLQTQTYDVALTDLHMPVHDGLELLRRLKTEHPTLMRVIHSSQVEAVAEPQVQEVAHAVLAKQSRPDELVSVLEWAIGERRRRVRDSVGF